MDNKGHVACLPEDLMIEIQLRLPPKSLMRFRCVCRAWNARFQDYFFVSAYHQRQKSDYSANSKVLVARMKKAAICHTVMKPVKEHDTFTAEEEVILQPANVPSGYARREWRLVGPCNGIICSQEIFVNRSFLSNPSTSWMEPLGNRIFLWNPTTREFKWLPKSPLPGRWYDIGIGYDCKTDDYKVVQLHEICYTGRNEWESSYRADLYSLRTNSWKEIRGCSGSIFDQRECTEGFHHWKGLRSIVSFDMKEEKFSNTVLPDSLLTESNSQSLFLTAFHGNLAVIDYAICYDKGARDKVFDIWVLKEVGLKGSWVRQSRIGPVNGVERPLRFWKDGMMFVQKRHENLALYNLKTNALKDLGVNFRRVLQLITYLPSLVRINGRPEHEEGIVHEAQRCQQDRA